jgi:hypothetical protein
LPEDRSIILGVPSRTTMAATLQGYPLTAGNAGELAELLQQARMA